MKANKFIKKLLVFLVLIFCQISALSQSTSYFETSKNIEIFTDLYKELDVFYVDEINSGDLIKTAIDKMLKSLDPYTNYIPESDIEDYKFMTTGQYGGIGATITKNGDYIYISEPYKDFPAQKAGLMAGDKILEVNGKSAKGKTSEELSSILKGQANTEVTILIKRNISDTIKFTFNREEVTVKSLQYFGIIENGVAYIKLRSFTRNCAKDIKRALIALQDHVSEDSLFDGKFKGIILDLRDNGGGLLDESIDIVNLFVEKGEEIVTTKGKIKDWDKTYKSKKMPQDLETPLIVLINSGSASASEIVSGSIQDLDRGVIIGQRSYGKGLVQQTKKLPYNAQLKVTVAKYYIPSGRCIQALDYSNRNEDGSVGSIPDSLISIFTTRNGREVKDGGGIFPDIEIENKKFANITYSLANKRLIFDFATQFRLQNKEITEPKSFYITDDVFDQFKTFLLDKEYEYTTATEDALQIVEEISKEEESFQLISEQLKLLDDAIKWNKKNDLHNNKEEISDFLANEIVSRYYYQEGRIIQSLKNDKYIEEALRIFNNLDEYDKILNLND